MKKTLLIAFSLVAVFFFAGTTESKAQWSVDVNYDDLSCSCTNITSKTIYWEIRYLDDNSIYLSGSEPFTGTGGYYLLDGNDDIEADTQFIVCVRISYYEAAVIEPCCTGYDCDEVVDSEDLENGDVEVWIEME